MSSNPVLDQLNSEVAAFPARASGEELYDYIRRLSGRILSKNRAELAAAMVDWLELRSEPKTMLAVQIASDLRLAELKPALESFLNDVREGRIFLPYYAKAIEATLQKL